MDNNIWNMTSTTTTKTINRIKTGIQKYLIFIVLLFNLALEIIGRLFKLGLHNAISPEFFVNFFVSTLTSMACYCCFIPLGRADEKIRASGFDELNDRWKTLSDTIRLGYQKIFEAFCKERVIEEKEEVKRFIIFNNTMMEYETYLEKYEKLSKKEVKQLYRKGELSKEEYKAIIGCLRVKVKPIIPLVVLQGARRTTINDAGRDDRSYALSKALQRPVTMLLISLVINSITTTFVGDTNVLFDIMLSVLSLVIASFFGYTTGANDFRCHEDRVKARVLFLSMFCEKNNISIKEN